MLFRSTTGVSTQVSVLPAGEGLPDEAANICAVSGSPGVELRWSGDRELTVIHPAESKIYEAARPFPGVRLSYEVQGQAASNNGMQRTRIQRLAQIQSPVRTADAGR